MVERLTHLLDIRLPCIQAPMAGVSTAALAGAVSKAGGLGSISVGTLSPVAADEAIREASSACGDNLNVNLFVHPRPRRDSAREARWLKGLDPLFRELGAEPTAGLSEIYRTLDDQPEMLEVLAAQRPPVISLHFGLPEPRNLQVLKAIGSRLMATATSVAEARTLEAAGIDIIIAQGFEAGGHRGNFGAEPDECLPTLELVARLAAEVEVPVVAAGGIMTGADIAEAMARGAAGAQMGTVFIDCPESAATEDFREALRAQGRRIVMTAVISGRRARGIGNRLVDEMQGHEPEVPDYPLAYDAAKQLAAAAVAAGCNDFTTMWAGSGRMRDTALPAGELLRRVEEELHSVGEA